MGGDDKDQTDAVVRLSCVIPDSRSKRVRLISGAKRRRCSFDIRVCVLF